MSKLREGDGGQVRPLEPGDVLTIPVRDRGGQVIKTITVFRTTREYVFDLRDAYNAARSADAIDRGVAWFVDQGGELKIGIDEAWSRSARKREAGRLETERARNVRLSLEAARRQQQDG